MTTRPRWQTLLFSLMVTSVALVAAFIASIPTFNQFMWRAKQNEAKVNLSRIYQLETAYKKRTGRFFGPDPGMAPLLLTTNDPHAYAIEGRVLIQNDLGYDDNSPSHRYFVSITSASMTAFVAVAKELVPSPKGAARIAWRCPAGEADEWQIDQDGSLRAVTDSVSTCWWPF